MWNTNRTASKSTNLILLQ